MKKRYRTAFDASAVGNADHPAQPDRHACGGISILPVDVEESVEEHHVQINYKNKKILFYTNKM